MSRFVALYGALFAAFGVSSPFLASYLASHDLLPGAIGIVLGSGTAIRLVAGPSITARADRSGRPRRCLVICIAAASIIALAYLPAYGLLPLLLVGLAYATVLAPTTAIADALTLAAVDRMSQYGWVRGAGSAAFIVGTLFAGQAVARAGLAATIWLSAGLLAVAMLAAIRIPDHLQTSSQALKTDPIDASAGFKLLFHLPGFIQLMLVAALIQGSHAMHDSFVVIHWRSLGVGDGAISVLWSESVAAEVFVFFLAGPFLLSRLGTGGASILAAAAGIARWSVLATSTAPIAWALVEPLHGLTFALQHLACMRMIQEIVPSHLNARAQAFYGTLSIGATTAVMTFVSGQLYARYQANGFWVMAAMCVIAIPIAHSIKATRSTSSSPIA
jgi:MFS transporter, PPP family, 3-phenylpropionic acid transporter